MSLSVHVTSEDAVVIVPVLEDTRGWQLRIADSNPDRRSLAVGPIHHLVAVHPTIADATGARGGR